MIAGSAARAAFDSGRARKRQGNVKYAGRSMRLARNGADRYDGRPACGVAGDHVGCGGKCVVGLCFDEGVVDERGRTFEVLRVAGVSPVKVRPFIAPNKSPG